MQKCLRTGMILINVEFSVKNSLAISARLLCAEPLSLRSDSQSSIYAHFSFVASNPPRPSSIGKCISVLRRLQKHKCKRRDAK